MEKPTRTRQITSPKKGSKKSELLSSDSGKKQTTTIKRRRQSAAIREAGKLYIKPILDKTKKPKPWKQLTLF